MSQHKLKIDDEVITRYLLGDVTQTDREVIEEEYLCEGEFFDRLLLVEDELITDYVKGSLSATDKSKFESYFLHSPERRQRLEETRALLQFISESTQKVKAKEQVSLWSLLRRLLMPEMPGIRLAYTAAMFLFLVGGIALAVKTLQLSRRLEVAQSEQRDAQARESSLKEEIDKQQAAQDALGNEVKDLTAQRNQLAEDLSKRIQQTPSFASIDLDSIPDDSASGFGPGKKRKTIKLPKSADVLRLTLKVPEPIEGTYSLILKTVGGEEILKKRNLSANKGIVNGKVVLTISSKTIQSGEYTIELNKQDSVGSNQLSKSLTLKITR